MAQIKIENLKNISLLEFNIPVGGVHVLTSINGSGKTTLLTCLERMANPYAFQRHFRTSTNSQFDDFRSAKITYSHGGSTVSYKYRNTNWSPTPKKGSAVLKSLGFNQVVYITSTGERFYVQNQELDTKNIVSAPQQIKDGMNEIFETTKFNDLRRVKLTGRGKGNNRRNFGFLLPLAAQGSHNAYFTERNFSLGEVLMLNALSQLIQAANRSLLLIDEIELALHPRVQVKFLHYLIRVAAQKNLTVILSTHSSSLIKSAPKLIYLERQSTGVINVEYDCYPAIALQNVAVMEEVQPDMVFFVEDIFGKYLLEGMLDYYFSRINAERKPIMKILPVGGYTQTVRLTIDSTVYLIPINTKVMCFLDLDVQTKIQALQAKPNPTPSEEDEMALFSNNRHCIKYLPVTPEQGIIELLTSNPSQHNLPLQNHFNAVFDISQIIIDENSRGLTYSSNPRDAAKVRMRYYVDRIMQAANIDEIRTKIMLAQYFANNYGQTHTGQLRGLFNPIFS